MAWQRTFPGFDWCWLLHCGWALLLAGCHPSQPFYLHEDGDLSHYLDAATEIEYPDVTRPSLPDTIGAHAPLTLSDPQFDEDWDLELEEAVSITLHNAKVMANLGSIASFDVSDPLIDRIGRGQVGTVYDPAIFETDPQQGVEAALSVFDAQLSILAGGNPSSAPLWNQTDIAQNRRANPFAPVVLQHGSGQVTTELAKQTATGTQWFARNVTTYDRGNRFGGVGGGFQALESFWSTAFQMELRQPLLRGRGAQINRIPIVLARINTDISLADFEGNVRNLVMDVERAYWDLYCAYRRLDAAKIGRDSALVTWRIVKEKFEQGAEPAQAEAQAAGQYYSFRAEVERALAGPDGVYENENRLRFLMGLSASDGRLIRPADEPLMARVSFSWSEALAESLVRSPELRQQKWRIKQRELELIAAKNELLPRFDARAVYEWIGVGDQLVKSDRSGLNFPQEGSTAFDELTEGKFQQFILGFDFVPPALGARRELAGVRNAQLQLRREEARLLEMERAQAHLLGRTLRQLDSSHHIATSHFNRWSAAENEVASVESLYQGGKATLDLVLDAQRRRAVAQNDYFQAICDYNTAMADVHFRKGSLLEHNSILLAEGPWPQKAYHDALGRARERDASHELEYGWTRPAVVSQGNPSPHLPNGPLPSGTESGVPAERIFSRPEEAEEPLDGSMPREEPDNE